MVYISLPASVALNLDSCASHKSLATRICRYVSTNLSPITLRTQSFKQTWYLTFGRSRGHKTFLASAILVGHVLSFGRRAFQNVIISSYFSLVHLCFAFNYIDSSVTFKRVSPSLHPSYNSVTTYFLSCTSLAFSLVAPLEFNGSLASSS